MALLCGAPWDCISVVSVALLCCLEFLVKEKGEGDGKPGVFISQGQPICLISYLIKPEVKTTEQAFPISQIQKFPLVRGKIEPPF